jgi:hypothetical protein
LRRGFVTYNDGYYATFRERLDSASHQSHHMADDNGGRWRSRSLTCNHCLVAGHGPCNRTVLTQPEQAASSANDRTITTAYAGVRQPDDFGMHRLCKLIRAMSAVRLRTVPVITRACTPSRSSRIWRVCSSTTSSRGQRGDRLLATGCYSGSLRTRSFN